MASSKKTAVVFLILLVWLIALSIINAFIPEIFNIIWSVRLLDISAAFALSVGIFVIAIRFWKHLISPKSTWKIDDVTAFVAVIALFVTYASFRNQGRLASEAMLSAEGQQSTEFEMNKPVLRCLYSNFGHDNDNCANKYIFKDANNWRQAIFYVESVFWQLEKAEKDKKEWGSVYSQDIKYWRSYVNEDTTGIFSYYLVNTNKTCAEAKSAMSRSVLDIKGFYQKYQRVWQSLKQARANPPAFITCQ